MTSSASNPRISVAMATYNGEKYLQEQLDSIARQTLLPIELVATDDGSTDATLTILEKFGQTSSFPVRVFRNESRLGFADNFLKAATLCQGDLIAFCDQDDIWMRQKLAVCSEFFRNPQVVLTVHTAQVSNRSNSGRYSYFPRLASTGVLKFADPFMHYSGFAMVFRSELLKLVNPAERPRRFPYHDQWMWFLAASAGRIVTIADTLAVYRQHDQNTFGAPPRKSASDQLQTASKVLQYDFDAEIELECACLLREAAPRVPHLSATLQEMATYLERRSKVYRLRARIYRPNSTLWSRSGTFLSMFGHAYYFSGPSRTPLGAHALTKDLLLGVSGAYKRYSRGPNAPASEL